MSDARTERIDAALGSAGTLIAALMDCGPVTPQQAHLIVMAVARASVPNVEEFEVRERARLIVREGGNGTTDQPR